MNLPSISIQLMTVHLCICDFSFLPIQYNSDVFNYLRLHLILLSKRREKEQHFFFCNIVIGSVMYDVYVRTNSLFCVVFCHYLCFQSIKALPYRYLIFLKISVLTLLTIRYHQVISQICIKKLLGDCRHYTVKTTVFGHSRYWFSFNVCPRLLCFINKSYFYGSSQIR